MLAAPAQTNVKAGGRKACRHCCLLRLVSGSPRAAAGVSAG